MGIFIGWVVRGRWFFIVGFVTVILALVIPWPSRGIHEALFVLGLAIMAVQLVVIVRETRRARLARRSPQPPTSN